MSKEPQDALAGLLLTLVPVDGSAVGNKALKDRFMAAAQEAGHAVSEADFDTLRESFITPSVLLCGKGRGGSVHRVDAHADESGFSLTTLPVQSDLTDAPRKTNAPAQPVAKVKAGDTTDIVSYRHQDKRKINPEVGMVRPENDPEDGKTRWCYDPHIHPALQ